MPNLKNLFLLATLILTFSCAKTIGELEGASGDGDKPTGETQEANPVPELISFSCATGAGLHGSTDCTITYPADTSEYLKLDIMRVKGNFTDTTTCLEGRNVFSINDFTQVNFDDITPSNTGEAYSYRVCVFGKNATMSSIKTSSLVNALDIYVPNNLKFWTCSSGAIQGEVSCDIEFPADTTDYASVTLRQIAGDTPPNSDCISDGTEVLNLNTTYNDQTVNLATGANI
jgi:hypothetical protein